MKNKKNILIVDDSPANLNLLNYILKGKGYNAWRAMSGVEALTLLESKKPDLILLDLMMPVMDGFEVCKKIGENKKLANIPIIVLSAASETNNKVEALKLGAVDYITKPFQEEELLSRIRTHLALKDKELKLQEYKKDLEKLVQERTRQLEISNAGLKAANSELRKQKEALEIALRKLNDTKAQLIHSEKMASLGVLVAGVAHEINNPINYINSSMQGLKNNLVFLDDYSKFYCHLTKDEKHLTDEMIEKEKEVSFVELTKMFKKSIELIEVGVDRTTNIVQSLKSFTRSSQDTIKLFNIEANIENTLIILGNYYKDRVEIRKKYGQVPDIECFPGKINQVFLNILLNAMEAIKGKGEIFITTAMKGENQVTIKIEDTGEGIDPGDLNDIFEAFYTTKGDNKGSGLGLSISYNIIKEHKGEIIVESEKGKGSSFTIVLPVKQ